MESVQEYCREYETLCREYCYVSILLVPGASRLVPVVQWGLMGNEARAILLRGFRLRFLRGIDTGGRTVQALPRETQVIGQMRRQKNYN